MPYKANVAIKDTHLMFAVGDIIPDDALGAKDIDHFLEIGAISKYKATSEEVKAAKDRIEEDKESVSYAIRHQAASVQKK